jgi:valyl-tRNA synthetase
VKVTPAHDERLRDSKRHNLIPIVVMTEDGKMSQNAGDCGRTA